MHEMRNQELCLVTNSLKIAYSTKFYSSLRTTVNATQSNLERKGEQTFSDYSIEVFSHDLQKTI